MQLEKLFKVLVLGGTTLAVGCNEAEPPPTQQGDPIETQPGGKLERKGTVVPDGAKGTGVVLVDAGSEADGGVSSWLHWF